MKKLTNLVVSLCCRFPVKYVELEYDTVGDLAKPPHDVSLQQIEIHAHNIDTIELRKCVELHGFQIVELVPRERGLFSGVWILTFKECEQ